MQSFGSLLPDGEFMQVVQREVMQGRALLVAFSLLYKGGGKKVQLVAELVGEPVSACMCVCLQMPSMGQSMPDSSTPP